MCRTMTVRWYEKVASNGASNLETLLTETEREIEEVVPRYGTKMKRCFENVILLVSNSWKYSKRAWPKKQIQ